MSYRAMLHIEGLSNNLYTELNQSQFLVSVTIYLRSILILYSHVRLGIRGNLFLKGYLLKCLKDLYLPPFCLFPRPF
jgi:hypothetical protein